MKTKFVALAAAAFAAVCRRARKPQSRSTAASCASITARTPPSMSIHEEATFSVNVAVDADLQQSRHLRSAQAAEQRCDTIVPELATSWAWSEDNKALTFKLREGVKWHDGKPFTAKDVKCTFDLLQGKSQDKFRKNPRKDWYVNVDDVTTNGDFEVTLPSQAAAAVDPGDARLRLHADLSLPRLGGADAHQSDRHRPVQVRRAEAERVDQAREEPGLLEEGPALSRRHRIHDHHEPRDRDARLRRRQGRHDLPDRNDGPR